MNSRSPLLMIVSFALALAGNAADQQAAHAPGKAEQTSQHQPTTAADAAQRDTSFIDDQGRAHITRIIPVPTYLSRESRYWLSTPVPDAGPPQSLAERRTKTDTWALGASKQWLALYPATVTEDKIAGVPVRIVVPADMPAANQDKVLLNLHGGGFNSDSGSYTETIPMAGMTRIKVVGVLYRLAPEFPFPAALDDSIRRLQRAAQDLQARPHRPLRHLRRSHPHRGSGGQAQAARPAYARRARHLLRHGRLRPLRRLASDVRAHRPLRPSRPARRGPRTTLITPARPTPKIPSFRPSTPTCTGMPPTLFITSGRDLLLSGTINLQRAFLNAGDDARLIVYDALPHAFWYSTKLPEAPRSQPRHGRLHAQAASQVITLRRN